MVRSPPVLPELPVLPMLLVELPERVAVYVPVLAKVRVDAAVWVEVWV